MDRSKRIARRLLPVLWPSFLMAGILEMMTFAVLDPEGMTWLDGMPFDWSRQAVYTVTFFIFWGVIATASSMTMLLTSRRLPHA